MSSAHTRSFFTGLLVKVVKNEFRTRLRSCGYSINIRQHIQKILPEWGDCRVFMPFYFNHKYGITARRQFLNAFLHCKFLAIWSKGWTYNIQTYNCCQNYTSDEVCLKQGGKKIIPNKLEFDHQNGESEEQTGGVEKQPHWNLMDGTASDAKL